MDKIALIIIFSSFGMNSKYTITDSIIISERIHVTDVYFDELDYILPNSISFLDMLTDSISILNYMDSTRSSIHIKDLKRGNWATMGTSRRFERGDTVSYRRRQCIELCEYIGYEDTGTIMDSDDEMAVIHYRSQLPELVNIIEEKYFTFFPFYQKDEYFPYHPFELKHFVDRELPFPEFDLYLTAFDTLYYDTITTMQIDSILALKSQLSELIR